MTVEEISWESKLSEELHNTIIDNSNSNEKIKVYIWYKDIKQGVVDKAVEAQTGLQKENIGKNLGMPDINILNNLLAFSDSSQESSNNIKKEMQAYLKKTEGQRQEVQKQASYSKVNMHQ